MVKSGAITAAVYVRYPASCTMQLSICFQLEVSSKSMIARVLSQEPLPVQQPEFIRTDSADHRVVETRIGGVLVEVSEYRGPFA